MLYIICILFVYSISFFYFIKKVNKKFNLYDYPVDKRKIHKKIVPFTGGLFIILFFNIFSIFKIYQGNPILFENTLYKSIFLLLYLNLFFFIGFLDDCNKISLNYRIISIVILIFFFIMTNELSIEFLNFRYLSQIHINLEYLQILFTIFCIFIFMNALNMFDGINGQSGLYILFFCLILLLITKNLDILFLIISILIFLYFNLKNKFFIGNSGINFLGCLLSYLVLKIYKIPTVILVEDILSLMFLPGIELCRLFFLRIASKKNPFISDKNHIHHILNKKFKLSNVLLINNFLAFSPYVLLNYIKVKFLVVFILFLYFYLVFLHKKNIK